MLKQFSTPEPEKQSPGDSAEPFDYEHEHRFAEHDYDEQPISNFKAINL